MNHQPTTARRARTSGLKRAAWAALPIVTLLSLVLAAGAADAQTAGTTRSPFATGMLSALTGSTLTVQARDGNNTTVVVTSSTGYLQTKSASASDIAQGDCVRVVGTGSATSGIQATTVVVTKPTSKGCTRNPNGATPGRGAGTGRFGNGPPGSGSAPFTSPNGSPVTLPNGSTVPTNIAAAFGTVSSVSGGQLSVKSQAPPTNKKSKAKTRTVTVTLTGSTTLTQTVKAAVSALAVGSCVTANGTVDSLGTITAKNVTISQPVNGSCGGGFGGFGGRFRGGAGGAAPATNGST
jgi:Domain of unknown function (DUF5666)